MWFKLCCWSTQCSTSLSISTVCISGYLFNVGKAATAAATEQVVKTAKQMKETVEEKVCLLTGTSTVQMCSQKVTDLSVRLLC